MTTPKLFISIVIFIACLALTAGTIALSEGTGVTRETTRVHPEKTLQLIKRIKDATESRVVVS